MASGETNISVVGNLTSDPELRATASGLSVANFTIASSPRIFDRASETWKDGPTLFLDCTVWREYAEHVAASLRKGSTVFATGRLTQRSYEAKDGTKRSAYLLEVDEVGPTLRFVTAELVRAVPPRDPADSESRELATVG